MGFVGRFDHTLDTKGRLILPVRFRPEFERGGTIAHHYEGCLALWTPGEFERQQSEMLELYRTGTRDSRNRARMWSLGATPKEIDRQGRLPIGQKARDFADLSTDILVIGSLDHIEIWSPERFMQRVAPAEDYFNGSDFDE